MFFVGNLKNTTKYKENHPDPTSITLFKSTFLGVASVSGGAHRHLEKVCKEMAECHFKIWVH